MFPWIWFWAPHLQFPFSGNVAQDYRPNTDWLFGSISEGSGNGAIEKKVFEDVATYGKQLGLITEVLIGLAEQGATQGTTLSPDQLDSLTRLKDIQLQVEEIKRNTYRKSVDDIETMVRAIQSRGGPEAHDLSARLLPLLAKGAD